MSIRESLRLARQWVVLVLSYGYDLKRYFRNASSSARPLTDAQLQARMLQKAHSLEKGLAMPSVRGGFGAVAITELATLLPEYERRGLDGDTAACRMVRNAAAEYCQFHDSNALPIPAALAVVRELAVPDLEVGAGGTEKRNAADSRREARGDFRALVFARRSTRIFAPGEVDPALIAEAVGLAQRSPSVCNRQAARVRHITGQPLLGQILALQGGNRGFTGLIPGFCLVTADLAAFRGGRERNQAWIDGGMFAMSLLYALTFVGLGTCPLNWSADPRQDRRLRTLARIPEGEVVIMLVAVGHLPDGYTVATSPRLALDDVLLPAPI